MVSIWFCRCRCRRQQNRPRERSRNDRIQCVHIHVLSLAVRAVGNPLTNIVDDGLVEKRAASGHALPGRRRTFEFLDQVAVVRVTGGNTQDCGLLDAGDSDERRKAVVCRG